MASPRGTRAVVAVFIVVVAAAAIYLGHRNGPLAGLAVLAGVAGLLVLLESAPRAILAFVLLGILAEDDPNWGINLTAAYQHGTAQPSPFQALEIIAVAAVVLHLAATRLPPRIPRPFGPALLFTGMGVVAATVTGISAGITSPSDLLLTIETVLPLLLLPFLIVNVVRTREQLREALGIGLAVAGAKGIAGLVVYFGGLAPEQPTIGRLTYYYPTTNLLMMLFLLAMFVAFLSRTPMPKWSKWLTPVVFLALVLSFRRTQWLGTGAAALILLLPASGRVGRRFVVPTIALLAVGVYLILTTGIAGGLQGPLVTRVESINATSVSQNQQDRYRLDERKNVLSALERSPLTGLGTGVAWPTRYPLGFDYPGGHLYVHVGLLWWWMKMGLIGIVAYLLLIGTAIVAGVRVWRRHSDPQIRVFGLAAAGMAIGLVVVELASTAIGDNERVSMLFGAVFGLLAAAYAQTRTQVDVGETDNLLTR